MAYSAMQEQGKQGTTTSNMAGAAAETAERVGSAVGKGMEHASDTVSRQGRDAAESAQAVAGNFKSAIDKSIKEQPTTTLLIAAAAGFLVGALWRS